MNPRLRSDTFRFFQLEELKGLLEKSGFAAAEVRREGTACLIAQCVKGDGEVAAAASAAAAPGSEAVQP